jgi:hypothetical protein
MAFGQALAERDSHLPDKIQVVIASYAKPRYIGGPRMKN